MKIAIQAADLDNKRIDGTRVYLLNVLKYLGKISPEDEFIIYHKANFNPELVPPNFKNYKIIKINNFKLWTQTRFALELWRNKTENLWMPMHNIPFLRRKNLKTVVTIHDLAFKQFPQTFPRADLFKLNLLTDLAVRKSDKIIAVSQSTKDDILKFYPEISADKIKVIYHGFDSELFKKEISEEEKNNALAKYNLKNKKYLLYVGAIQPRKNLELLVESFELYKKKNGNDLKLVLAGSKAWNWKKTIEAVKNSPQEKNIILTDKVSFVDLAVLYREACLFVFPSLYEGFGIPVLEAFASGIPVITANNSSLTEVGGEAALYFEDENSIQLANKIEEVLSDNNLREKMIKNGEAQMKKFSWEKCARETLAVIKT